MASRGLPLAGEAGTGRVGAGRGLQPDALPSPPDLERVQRSRPAERPRGPRRPGRGVPAAPRQKAERVVVGGAGVWDGGGGSLDMAEGCHLGRGQMPCAQPRSFTRTMEETPGGKGSWMARARATEGRHAGASPGKKPVLWGVRREGPRGLASAFAKEWQWLEAERICPRWQRLTTSKMAGAW